MNRSHSENSASELGNVDRKCFLRISVVTLFPEMFDALTSSGITRRAFEQGAVELNLVNPRDFAEDKHRTVDDRPYGGGPGMVMKIEPLERALLACIGEGTYSANDYKVFCDKALEKKRAEFEVIYMSPQGELLDRSLLAALVGASDEDAELGDAPCAESSIDETGIAKQLVIIAGRYEGIDERFIEKYVDREISIGDYVLSGGELASMVLLDGIIRRLPGVLGAAESVEQDSFEDGLLDCPHYTRPEYYFDQRVPDVLLSGDHKRIALWRRQQSLGRTWLRKPALLNEQNLSESDQHLLDVFKKAHCDENF